MTARKGALYGGLIALILSAILIALGLNAANGDPLIRSEGAGNQTHRAGNAELLAVSEAKVFFGHQSVGGNVISGLPTVYSEQGIEPPLIVESRSHITDEPSYFQHAAIGQNGDPSGKIKDFADIVRGGVGREVGVAFMKFCYIDIGPETDIEELFAEYRDTMAQLQAEFPGIAFLHVTTPLTTEPDLKNKIKSLVGKGSDDSYRTAHNVARERLNQLIRAEYEVAPYLFDLASVESTTPDGDRVGGEYQGENYFALYSGYASDPGHLNEEGSEIAASALVTAVAGVSERAK